MNAESLCIGPEPLTFGQRSGMTLREFNRRLNDYLKRKRLTGKNWCDSHRENRQAFLRRQREQSAARFRRAGLLRRGRERDLWSQL